MEAVKNLRLIGFVILGFGLFTYLSSVLNKEMAHGDPGSIIGAYLFAALLFSIGVGFLALSGIIYLVIKKKKRKK